MRYELMLPRQIRQAIEEGWPVVLPVGVLEYHGEHLIIGVDTLLVVRALEALEEELNLVLLPPFTYGAASHVVEPPENRGTVHVRADHLAPLAKDLFGGLLRVGFRNIHFIIHHQTENFAAGMPTDLAFKLAARQAVFDFLERERGEGWWGQNRMADYYTKHEKGQNPFNWIQGHPLLDATALREFPFDHGGEGEASLMMALCPEGVDMHGLSDQKWYMRSARAASLDLGERGKALILKHLRAALTGGRPKPG